jgi:WD40 repeat protein
MSQQPLAQNSAISEPKVNRAARASVISNISRFGDEEDLQNSTDKSENHSPESDNTHPDSQLEVHQERPEISSESDSDEDESEEGADEEENAVGLSAYTSTSISKLDKINKIFLNKRDSKSNVAEVTKLNKRLSKHIESMRLFKKEPLLTSTLPKNFYISRLFSTFDIHSNTEFGIFNHYDSIKIWRKYQEKVVTTNLIQTENEVYCSTVLGNEILEGHAIFSNYSADIGLIDIESRKVTRTYHVNKPFKQITNYITSQNTQIFAGFADGCIRLFDSRAKHSTGLLDEHMDSTTNDSNKYYFNPITNIQVVDENHLFTGCTKKLILWDLRNVKSVQTIIDPQKDCGGMTKSLLYPNKPEACLSVSSDDSKVIVWDLSKGTQIKEVKVKGKIRDIAVFSDLDELLVLTDPTLNENPIKKSLVQLFETRNETLKEIDGFDLDDNFSHMKLSSSGKFLWILNEFKVSIWDYYAKENMSTIKDKLNELLLMDN